MAGEGQGQVPDTLRPDADEKLGAVPVEQAGFLDVMRWLLTRKTGRWDPASKSHEPGPPPPERVEPERVRVTFINHSTVLLQVGTLNLITDPIYAGRASPFSFVGPKRARPPGIRFDDLPPIDAILLSHNHYDHCCVDTLGRLLKRDNPAIFTGRGNRPLMESVGFQSVTELNWWESTRMRRAVTLTYVPARHFSGRGIFDRDKTLWGGFYLDAPEARIYFAGDTADGPHFEAIRERLGAPDLALLPIGAYEPPEIMKAVHTNPEEAVDAHIRLGARHSVAIHFGTFPLTDEGQWDPPERLDRALSAAGLTRNDFWVLNFGEGRCLTANAQPTLGGANSSR